MSEPCTHAGEIGAMLEQIKGLSKRMDAYEETQKTLIKLSESVALIAKDMSHIGENVASVKLDVGSVKTEIKEIKDNQNVLETKQDVDNSQNWKYMWKRIGDLVLGAVIAYLLSKGGL